MKLGKLPARKDAVKLKLSNYGTLPVAPKSFKLFTTVSDWQGMLGNDRYGDCVWAGADHETILWNAERGQAVRFTEQNALSDYSAVTGFNPNDPNSDQGTDMQQAASYRRKTGVTDASGKRHTVAAYLAITPGNKDELKQAIYLFSNVGIGIEFPDYAMYQFNAGKSWHLQRGGTIEGGHYIPAVGYDGRYVYVVTWGKVQKMSWGFFAKYCDEAIVYLSDEFLTGALSPEGFNLSALNNDLAQLT